MRRYRSRRRRTRRFGRRRSRKFLSRGGIALRA